MERPKQRRPSSAEAVAIFPEQLRIGGRFTNNDGEWEVASRPVTFKQGFDGDHFVFGPLNQLDVEHIIMALHEFRER